MTSIPNSVSLESLESYAENAQKESTKDSFSDLTKEQKQKFVQEFVHELLSDADDLFAIKIMIHYGQFILFNYHIDNYEQALKEANQEVALAWAKDAGKILAMSTNLETIQMGPSDFMTPMN